MTVGVKSNIVQVVTSRIRLILLIRCHIYRKIWWAITMRWISLVPS